MKKLFLTLVAASIVFAASAQINKGAILVSGSSNFGYNNISPDNSSGYNVINLDLKAGYFIINNLALGLNIDYTKIEDSSLTSIGAFGRYYIAGKFFAGAGFNSVDNGSDSSTEIPLEVGFAGFVSDAIAIEPALSYTMGDGYERFGLNIGLSLYFNR